MGRKDISRARKIKTIGITFNLKKKGGKLGQYEEYDEAATIEALKGEIEKLGFKVELFEQNHSFPEKIRAKKPDFVFNIAEGIGASRGRESQVPCVLESLGLPYSGSDPISIGITLDKYFTNVFLLSSGVPVPEMHLVRDGKDMEALKYLFDVKKRYIVKPRWEGSSKGIFLRSVVKDFKSFKRLSEEIIREFRQPALIEEFLEGAEVTAAVAGNGQAEVLGMMKITPTDVPEKDFLYSIETKREWKKKVRYESEGSLSERTRKDVRECAAKAYKALELRDISRIDFRLDGRGVPRIIDINPLPGLSPAYSDLPILYRLKGGTYSDLVKTILRGSLERHGFDCRF